MAAIASSIIDGLRHESRIAGRTDHRRKEPDAEGDILGCVDVPVPVALELVLHPSCTLRPTEQTHLRCCNGLRTLMIIDGTTDIPAHLTRPIRMMAGPAILSGIVA